MMQELLVDSTFKVAVGKETHDLAQQSWQQHGDRAKAKQVYLNTLSVFAVDRFLRCLQIKTDRSVSCSRDPMFQALMDVADLKIPNVGQLECRPVLPDADVVSIPPEVRSERIGYVAVQLDNSLQEATLLGFTIKVPESGEVAIAQLQPIAQLPGYIQQIQPLETLLATSPISTLRHWYLYQLHENSIQGVKLIDLGLQLENQSLALLIVLIPESDRQYSKVLIQVHPTGKENYLPPNIQLALLDESGETLRSVQSRARDNYIQLKQFRGEARGCFNIQVDCSDGMTETFIIRPLY